MKLSTQVSISKSEATLSHNVPALLIGSCFSQNIGNKLIDHKFAVHVNPNGIVFNPISVVNSLKRIADHETYTADELQQYDNKWFSFNHHSSFSSFDKTQCLKGINTALTEAHNYLQKTETIFITLGSAWVYEYEPIGIVANCHKIPNKNFSKRLLSVKEILTAFDSIKNVLKHYNLVFTVSPVRHSKDGLHENNLSKSTLHLALHNLVEQHSNCAYFPAYELVIDELRDYRFFKDDLVHPSNFAVNYVWEKFSDCFFNESTIALNTAIQKIKAAVHHKPFNFNSEAHQTFIKNNLALMDDLSKKNAFLNFEEEKRLLQKS